MNKDLRLYRSIDFEYRSNIRVNIRVHALRTRRNSTGEGKGAEFCNPFGKLGNRVALRRVIWTICARRNARKILFDRVIDRSRSQIQFST